MPIGIIINACATLIGGILGMLIGHKIPKQLGERLPIIFGVSSMGMGIFNIVKMDNLTAVVLSIVLGTIVGELIHIEKGIQFGGKKVASLFSSKAGSSNQSSDNIQLFVTVVVLFCASGTGISGALTEGMTGDASVLMTKAILDFFTAAIFATTLGYLVPIIAVPQFVVLFILFLCADFILPLTNATMLADFAAAGGFIMLANGFNMTKIKAIPVASMIPAFVLIMPISYLWSLFF